MSIPDGFAVERLTLPITRDLKASGWKMLSFDGIPASDFQGTIDGVMDVRADQSSSVLYTEIPKDSAHATHLTWSWQVIDGLKASNLKHVGRDDRVLALHVVFADDDMMSMIKGALSPFARGHALSYVWGGQRIEQFPHPHLPDKAWMIIRQTENAPTGVWVNEKVDLKADYMRAFGAEPPEIAYIGVSGDADDLRTRSFGKIRAITLN